MRLRMWRADTAAAEEMFYVGAKVDLARRPSVSIEYLRAGRDYKRASHQTWGRELLDAFILRVRMRIDPNGRLCADLRKTILALAHVPLQRFWVARARGLGAAFPLAHSM